MVCRIYQQPSAQEVHIQHEKVVEQLAERFPQAATMLDEAGADILAFTHFPMEHWKKNLVEQSAGAVEQGEPSQDRCGRHLPEQIGSNAAGWRGTRRAERLVDGRQTIPDADFTDLQRGAAGGAAHTAYCGLVEQKDLRSTTPLDGTRPWCQPAYTLHHRSC